MNSELTNPMISMVTVVLNGEKQLEACIQSVLSQNCENLEYIIVDGGSTDGTLEIVKKYETRIKHWVSENDHGIADAYNKGIAMSSGEFIGFINADDCLCPNALSRVFESFEEGIDIVYGDLIQKSENGIDYRIAARHDLLKSKMSLNFPATFVRKSVFHKLGSFDTGYRIAMDYEFLLRCVVDDMTFSYCPFALTQRSYGGVSDKNWLAGLREVKKAKNKHLGKRINHLFSFWRTAAATFVSQTLLDSFLSSLFNRYRAKLARVKKEPIE